MFYSDQVLISFLVNTMAMPCYSPLLLSTHLALFTYLVSVVAASYIVTSEVLQLGTSDVKNLAISVFLSLGYLLSIYFPSSIHFTSNFVILFSLYVPHFC